MRFALLGDHPDGLAMARALAASGRHVLSVYTGAPAGLSVLQRDGLQPQRAGDLEDALAEPAIEAVIVAGLASERPAQLRRALQSEHHVLCVHPVDPSADFAYEAALLQSDVRRVLLPLLPETLHPGVARIAQIARIMRGETPDQGQSPFTGSLRLIEFERWSPEECLLGVDDDGTKLGVPGWDVLRAVGGEIAEVFGFASSDELAPGEPAVLSGRFTLGGLWRATLLPRQNRAFWRFALVGSAGVAELTFPDGWPGVARLSYVDDQGEPRVEEWAAHHPWAALVDLFDAALHENETRRAVVEPGVTESVCLTTQDGRLGWLDAIRGLELDDAVRRSVQRGRANSLDFPEATEEASFKGAMTLVGCSLIWVSLLLLILSVWVPWLGWLILPVFGIFLLMQVLRGVVK